MSSQPLHEQITKLQEELAAERLSHRVCQSGRHVMRRRRQLRHQAYPHAASTERLELAKHRAKMVGSLMAPCTEQAEPVASPVVMRGHKPPLEGAQVEGNQRLSGVEVLLAVAGGDQVNVAAQLARLVGRLDAAAVAALAPAP